MPEQGRNEQRREPRRGSQILLVVVVLSALAGLMHVRLGGEWSAVGAVLMSRTVLEVGLVFLASLGILELIHIGPRFPEEMEKSDSQSNEQPPILDDPEILQAYIEVWKKTVDVQQHFNEIEMRIRRFAVTLLVTLIGAAGLALREGFTALALVLLMAGLISWGAFYFMDRHWYHRMLIGSVRHGKKVEKRLSERIPDIGLTGAIGDSSPIKARYPLPFFGDSRRGLNEMHSEGKMRLFYWVVALALVMMMTVVGSMP